MYHINAYHVQRTSNIFLFLSGHKNWVLYLAWSPDCKHLVSGSKSGELITWDPLTGKPSGSPLTVNNLILFHILPFCTFILQFILQNNH